MNMIINDIGLVLLGLSVAGVIFAFAYHQGWKAGMRQGKAIGEILGYDRGKKSSEHQAIRGDSGFRIVENIFSDIDKK
jgi:hypothetical protein